MGRLTALTYNVQHAILDEGPEWEQRRSGVAERIRTADPDVLGLQECAGEQHGDVAADLPGYEWVGVATEPGSGEHDPIGYREEWSLIETETRWLSKSGEPGSVGWDAGYPRVVTTATLRDETGDVVTVCNTHFDHLGPQARKESATLLQRLVDEFPSDRPIIALGDFNTEPGQPAYDQLVNGDGSRQLHDARAVAAATSGPGTTLTDFDSLRPNRAVDHVFVISNLSVEQYAVDTAKANGQFPSDHLPVVATCRY